MVPSVTSIMLRRNISVSPLKKSEVNTVTKFCTLHIFWKINVLYASLYKSNVEALEIYNPLKQTTIQYSLSFTELESQASIVHICKDITLLYKQAKEIHILNKRIELSLKGFKAGIYEWDMLDNSAYLSSEWKMMLGYDKNEAIS